MRKQRLEEEERGKQLRSEAGEVIVSRTCKFPDQGKELGLTLELGNVG